MISSCSDSRNHKLLDVCVEAVYAIQTTWTVTNEVFESLKAEIDVVGHGIGHPGICSRPDWW